MLEEYPKNDIGLLYIDESPFGFAWYGDSEGAIEGPRTKEMWERLQDALQEVRSGRGVCGIVARGFGCTAALALAEQLPVDRLLLYGLSWEVPRAYTPPRLLRRMAAYARRNLALCVADTLIVDCVGSQSRLSGWSSQCRVRRVGIPGGTGNKMYTIREIASKKAISCFLHTGELPKTLAQNSEMCIIDG